MASLFIRGLGGGKNFPHPNPPPKLGEGVKKLVPPAISGGARGREKTHPHPNPPPKLGEGVKKIRSPLPFREGARGREKLTPPSPEIGGGRKKLGPPPFSGGRKKISSPSHFGRGLGGGQ